MAPPKFPPSHCPAGQGEPTPPSCCPRPPRPRFWDCSVCLHTPHGHRHHGPGGLPHPRARCRVPDSPQPGRPPGGPGPPHSQATTTRFQEFKQKWGTQQLPGEEKGHSFHPQPSKNTSNLKTKVSGHCSCQVPREPVPFPAPRRGRGPAGSSWVSPPPPLCSLLLATRSSERTFWKLVVAMKTAVHFVSLERSSDVGIFLTFYFFALKTLPKSLREGGGKQGGGAVSGPGRRQEPPRGEV